MARLGSRPRSIRSASSALQAAAFSVAPSRNPSTCFVPLLSMPTAANTTCSAKCTPSIIKATSASPLKIAPHQFRESALGPHYEAFAHRALAHAPDFELVRQCFQRARITARRDTQHHLLEGPFIERVARTPRLPARQAQFMPVDTARAWPPAAHHQRARHLPRALRLALRP